MLRKNYFYIGLIVLYILFLSKDFLMGSFINNFSSLKNKSITILDNYYRLEYEKISKMLDVQVESKEIVVSRIIEQNIYYFFDKITILKGENAGLKIGDIVINEKGVVGVIAKLNKNTSEVSLLSNKDINLSVKINDSYGIIYAKDNKIMVKNIKLNKEIKEGDKIVTSGLTNVPEGLLVGNVKKILKDNLELEYVVEVEPAVDFYQLNYVGVVK